MTTYNAVAKNAWRKITEMIEVKAHYPLKLEDLQSFRSVLWVDRTVHVIEDK